MLKNLLIMINVLLKDLKALLNLLYPREKNCLVLNYWLAHKKKIGVFGHVLCLIINPYIIMITTIIIIVLMRVFFIYHMSHPLMLEETIPITPPNIDKVTTYLLDNIRKETDLYIKKAQRSHTYPTEEQLWDIAIKIVGNTLKFEKNLSLYSDEHPVTLIHHEILNRIEIVKNLEPTKANFKYLEELALLLRVITAWMLSEDQITVGVEGTYDCTTVKECLHKISEI